MPLRLLPVNHFDGAVISGASAFSTLPLTNLQSNVRDKVWRSVNLEPQVIVGHWNGNVRTVSAFQVWVARGRSSLIGSKWRLELFQDASLVTLAYDSGTVDYFTFSGDPWGSFSWGASPWGAAQDDRTARLAPLCRYFSAVNASSFRITVTNGGAVDTPYFEASRIWLADAVTAPYNARFGAAPIWDGSSTNDRPVGGSLRRRVGERWRALPIETMFASEADRAAWSDLTYVFDQATEVVISLFPGEGSRRERDFTVMGSLKLLNPMVFQNRNFHTLQLSMVES